MKHPHQCLCPRAHLSTGASRDLHGCDPTAMLIHLNQLLLLLGHDQALLEHLVFSPESRDLILDLSTRIATVRVLQLFLVGQGLLLNL